MQFEEYLISKKIDSKAFKEGDETMWSEFKSLFEQMHPNSFTAQKLYLINNIRRKYHLKEETAKEPLVEKKIVKPVVKSSKPKMPGKPVMKRPKLK